MNSLATWGDSRRGFTLIEVLVVIGIVGLVLVFNTLVDLNYYRRELSASEISVLVSTLQKARSRAMNNMHETVHGVYLDDPDSYIIFRDSTYNPGAPTNEAIPRNPNLTLSSPFSSVYFDQLSGDASDTGDIVLSDGFKNHTISVLANGMIVW